jgi:cytosine deaminase
MFDLVLRRARLLERAGEWEVAIGQGRVAEVVPAVASAARTSIDLESRLLLPGFVDAHVHLDKAFLDERPGLRGTTGPAFFAGLKQAKREATSDEIKSRMRRALEAAVRNGTTAMRAQVDVDDVVGLRGFEAALALKREWAAWISLQVLVFPQEGIVGNQQAGALVRDALDLGGDIIGGGAAFDPATPERHLEAVFDLAREFDRDIDLHVDIGTRPEQPLAEWELSHVARLTRQAGWQGRVTVAHLTQLGQMPTGRAEEVADLLLEAGINVTVVPSAELNTARAWGAEPARDINQAMSNLELLLIRGLNVGYSTGHLADSFSPYGNGDMLLDGLVLACARNLGDPLIAGLPVLSLATARPARTLRLPGPYGVQAGALADLVVLDAPDAARALRHQAEKWLVLKAGCPVARSRRTTEAAWQSGGLAC